MNLVLFYEVLSAGIFRKSEAKRSTEDLSVELMII